MYRFLIFWVFTSIYFYSKAQFITTYYPNGKIKSEGCVSVVNKDTLKQGPWKLYFTTGKINAEGSYFNGKMHGEWKYYHASNGALEKTEQWRFGKQEGEQREFFPTGKLAKSITYKNGVYEGAFTSFFPSGKIKNKGMYQAGFPGGVWDSFHEDGYLMESATYENGILNGLYKSYYPTGIVQAEGYYSKGEKTGEWLYYDEKGEILKEPSKKKRRRNKK